ncbi:helix-turn-helix domain-containing protein [Flocculibacter collagenilyticus]|uniref:helix-turn-helix domain-containing protein n=1 Tax=Flocculibacter collagenilyticus TaxID=2744479 RepID=UPI0018F520A1|nr:AraC family transcriptional regulator [Flocculibacter collagenilyticus]
MHSSHAIDIGHEYIDTMKAEEHGSQTEYILSFVVNGSITMRHRELIELKNNMFSLIPAGMPHSIVNGENVEVWWVSFCPNCLNLNEDDSIMQPFRQIRLGALPVLKLPTERVHYLHSLFNELNTIIKHEQHCDIEVLKSLLVLILYEVKKSSQIEKSIAATHSKVVSALDYIQRHFLNAISLKDVAKAIHTSPSHLATLVKQDTGFSIGEWITRHRLTEACSRLIHTQDQIQVIVEELGWSDTTHFIRQFKKAYGETPAAWRKQQKEKVK